jgi:hypothetical protein
MWHECRRREILVEKPEGKRRLEDLAVKWKDKIKADFKFIAWIEFMWLRLATSGGLLWTR